MNFIKEYQDYGCKLTDADPIFHLAVSLALIAAAVGNRIWFWFGDKKLFLNLFLLLLGDSSQTRKTTCLNIGKSILHHTKPDAIFINEGSYEKILALLSKFPAGIFFYNEFMSLISMISRDYNIALKSFFTDIFDGCDIYRRQTMGGSDVEIENPAVSIAAASTIEWFQSRLPEDDYRGGFIVRFLTVQGRRKGPLIPLPPPVDQDQKGMLIKELKRLASITGVAKLSDEARQLHDAWYINHSNNMGAFKFAAFFSRLQGYLIKISIIFELASSHSLVVSGDAMREAVSFIDQVALDLRRLQNDDLVFSKGQRHIKIVKQYLDGRGRVPRSKLLTSTRLSARELNEAILTLIESEQVVVHSEKIESSRKSRLLYELIVSY